MTFSVWGPPAVANLANNVVGHCQRVTRALVEFSFLAFGAYIGLKEQINTKQGNLEFDIQMGFSQSSHKTCRGCSTVFGDHLLREHKNTLTCSSDTHP